MNARENSTYNWATGSAMMSVCFILMGAYLILPGDWILIMLEMFFLLGIGYQWIALKEKKELFALDQEYAP